MINSFFAFLGRPFVLLFKQLSNFGKFIIFQLQLIPLYFSYPFRIQQTFSQIDAIGVGTFWVIFLTALFTGMVESIQLYEGFHQFGAESFMGYTIFISITKELGPVFGALMLVSRAISSMAAELGTMRVTEQIDAIDILGLDSRKYLLIPRIIATTISLPLLVIIFDFVANFSAYLVSIYILDINSVEYKNTILQFLKFSDIYTGVIKAFVFGFLVGSIGAYVGYTTYGGARGVGISTTKAVIYSAITIFGANYLISSMFMILNV
jgi:phospholipid/cholesterol/gamma-HCH transport system permease protein